MKHASSIEQAKRTYIHIISQRWKLSEFSKEFSTEFSEFSKEFSTEFSEFSTEFSTEFSINPNGNFWKFPKLFGIFRIFQNFSEFSEIFKTFWKLLKISKEISGNFPTFNLLHNAVYAGHRKASKTHHFNKTTYIIIFFIKFNPFHMIYNPFTWFFIFDNLKNF